MQDERSSRWQDEGKFVKIYRWSKRVREKSVEATATDTSRCSIMSPEMLRLICFSSTLLVSVIILPTRSFAESAPNQTVGDAINTLSNSSIMSTNNSLVEPMLNSSAHLNPPLISKVMDRNETINSTKTTDEMDKNRSESVVYTITVNSTDLDEEPGDSGVRQRRGLAGEHNTDLLSSAESNRHEKSVKPDLETGSVGVKFESETNVALANKPKLSSRSVKFLKRMRNKMKAKESNLTVAASQNQRKWLDFNGRPPPFDRHKIFVPDTTFESSDELPVKEEAVANVKGSKTAGEVQVKRESSSTKEDEKPTVNRSTTTTTTIVDGKKKAKLVSKGAKLPPGLRRRIIQQFVKDGGDPQNIVVSDSTITTTSQSKKKTVTTVYKMEPNSNPRLSNFPMLKPVIIKEDISNEDSPGSFKSGKFMQPMVNMSEDDKLDMGNDFGGKLDRPRKLKKIVVTRTEVPQTMFMDKRKNEEDLGEFYQGPHEAMMGLGENPDQFSGPQKKAIMSLDKMVENAFAPELKFGKKRPMKMHMQMDSMFGEQDEGHKKPRGVGGGGISLEALMQALKPTSKQEFPKMKMNMNDFLYDQDDKMKDIMGDDLGKGYQQMTSKHLSNFHELNMKSAPNKKASETGSSNSQVDSGVGPPTSGAKQESSGGRKTGEQHSSQRRPPGGATSKASGVDPPKISKSPEMGSREKQQSDEESAGSRELTDKKSADKGASGRSERADGARKGDASANETPKVKSKKVDSLEELKRLALAGSSKRLKDPKSSSPSGSGSTQPPPTSTTTRQPNKLDTEGFTASVGTSAGDKAAERTKKAPAKIAPAKLPTQKQVAESGLDKQSSEESASKRAAQVTAPKGKTHNIMMLIDFSPTSQPADGDKARKLDTSASHPLAKTREFGSRQPTGDNQWVPLKQEQRPQVLASGQPPSVNVQIYNNHLSREETRDPRLQQQQAAIDYDEAGMDQSGMFDAAAGSHLYRYRAPLPPEHVHPFYMTSGFQNPLAGEPEGRAESQLATSAETPILPDESADTNRMLKRVIDELAMSATNEHPASDAQGHYTTTSVHDSEAASEVVDEDDDDGMITSDHFDSASAASSFGV